MGLFRRQRDAAKTVAPAPPSSRRELSRRGEVASDKSDASDVVAPSERAPISVVPATFRTIQLEPHIDAAGGGVEESDVFVCRRGVEAPPVEVVEVAAMQAAAEGVTLFVYGWENVQPGPLSWVFPSLRSALTAVRTMRNAVEWCICSGDAWDDIDAARAQGAVLVEQSV